MFDIFDAIGSIIHSLVNDASSHADIHEHIAGGLQPSSGELAAPTFGSWEQSGYSGTWYERAPDGSYTGNWHR